MPLQDGMLTPEQLAGLLAAIGALIGALGLRAVREGRRERDSADLPPPLTRERFDEEIGEVKGLIRAHHQDTRQENRDARDRLVQIEARLDARRRR